MFSPKSNVRVTAGVYKGKSGVVVHETPRKLKLKLDDGVTTGLVCNSRTHKLFVLSGPVYFSNLLEKYFYTPLFDCTIVAVNAVAFNRLYHQREWRQTFVVPNKWCAFI